MTVQDIIQINPFERVSVDPDQLAKLHADLGEAGAEDVVCRAMEELAQRLSHCDKYYNQGKWRDLRKSARSIVAIAEQIGMIKLARVAEDVTNCIDAKDDVALSSTITRLMRIGEGSLSAIWDIQDITI